MKITKFLIVFVFTVFSGSLYADQGFVYSTTTSVKYMTESSEDELERCLEDFNNKTFGSEVFGVNTEYKEYPNLYKLINNPTDHFEPENGTNNSKFIHPETGITFLGTQGGTGNNMNGFSVLNAFRDDFVDYWRSNRARMGSNMAHLGVIFPEPRMPSYLRVIGGRTDNTDVAMRNVRIEVKESIGGEWKTLNVGNMNGVDNNIMVEEDYLIPLNLDKKYIGFRVVGQKVLAISYYYTRLTRFSLLIENKC